MESNSRKKSITNIINISIIMLLTTLITMHALLYGNCEDLNLYDKTITYEVKAGTELAIEKANDYFISANTSKSDMFEINKADNAKKIPSIIAYAAIPNSICFNTILLVIFIIFCLTSFKFLPDDWTLINQKVRLDD